MGVVMGRRQTHAALPTVQKTKGQHATNSFLQTSVCCQGINQREGRHRSEFGFHVQSSYAVRGTTKAKTRTLK